MARKAAQECRYDQVPARHHLAFDQSVLDPGSNGVAAGIIDADCVALGRNNNWRHSRWCGD